MSDLMVRILHDTPALVIRDIACSGTCRHAGPEECATGTHLAFPYRGVFARHVGRQEAVGDVNQLIVFNDGEGYRISHPAEGGDACLSFLFADDVLAELAPPEQVVGSGPLRFRRQHRGIDPAAQALATRLRYRLAHGAGETLEAETMAFALVRRSLGDRTSYARPSRFGRQKIVSRAKVILASDVSRRWSLAEIGRAVGVSPVYLTQLFKEVEGVPLYRYHLRLRLAHALDRLEGCHDLTGLALDSGFSSHSHFTAAFRQAYGESPRAFQRSTGTR